MGQPSGVSRIQSMVRPMIGRTMPGKPVAPAQIASRLIAISRHAPYTTPAIPVSIGWETKSRGSVTLPVRALAATVRGDAR
jgi:hypothetical protein